jgi:6-phospho-3-hexuloisomerase
MEKDSRMFHQMAQQAVSEVGSVLAQVQTAAVDVMCAEILKARHIACYGVGREGLLMKAFCMRLMHLGLDAHAVGEMTAPPLFAGDLLIASAAPGLVLDSDGAVGSRARCGSTHHGRNCTTLRTRVSNSRPDNGVTGANHGQ